MPRPLNFDANSHLTQIRVGILHSLTGTMAISEASLKDAELMAISEINHNGGVLGKELIPIIEDGASDPLKFAQQAQKLITQDQVATIFGCWTSASRKAVLPVVEALNTLLWYPVQYEGLESSPNIFYLGSCPNQQVETAINWLLEQQKNRFYLIGSDYIFPRTVNKLIRSQLKLQQGKILGEEYCALGSTDFSQTIAKIQYTQPDVVINTLNGDSNFSFYEQYAKAGITAAQIPILAFSVAEGELQQMKAAASGHYASWSYFQSLDNPNNHQFIQNFQRNYGANRVTSDPIEAAYTQVYLWKQAVESAQSLATDAVRAAAVGQTFAAPSGMVTIAANQHLWKACRIGKFLPSGQFQIVFDSQATIKPLPWLGVEEMSGNGGGVIIELLTEIAQGIEKAKELERALEELKQAQIQLIQTEKMSSLGQLVAGVAHEINNPINFIHGNLFYAHQYIDNILQLLALYEAATPEVSPQIIEFSEEIDLEFTKKDLPYLLKSMQFGTERIRDIVSNLKIFSRLDESGMKTVDIHEGIESTLIILGGRFKPLSNRVAIQIIKEYGDVPKVHCLPGQLNQVFMNILINAIDAIEEKFTLATGQSDQDDLGNPMIQIATEVTDAGWVMIRIADNGAGIASELHKNLFDPFFTTKPVGKGTGLGMSISYQIVTQKHHGQITFTSELGKGTEFTIMLPLQITEVIAN
ncbi:MAG: urea ABC transporter substrate-binding protein [Pseudanabaena sp. ELA607]